MYNKFQLGLKYLRYYFSASGGRGHGVHSPFVFDFITTILNDRRFFYAYREVEILRKSALRNNTIIDVEDLGAGSSGVSSRQRRVKDIARWSLKSPKYGRLLFRMVDHYQPGVIIELGTSLGITTAYLALGQRSAKVYTLEGATSIAAIAQRHFAQLGLPNVYLTEGDFDNTLSPVLQQSGPPGLVFIDGNHRLEPTLRYFNRLLPYALAHSIFVFDDIHWSAEMEQAWQTIRNHPAVTCSIDLFFIGIVFFSPDFKERQDFSIRF